MNPISTRQATKPISGNSNASFEFVAAPVILALIGLWLDKSVFHTTPIITVAFAILGLVGATIKLYYGYKFQMQQHAEAATWARPKSATTAVADES